MQNLLDKIKGCLIGGAAGDALGFPVEFLSYSQIERRYGDGGVWAYDTNFDMYRSGKALVSDDTQMTMMAVFALTNDVFVGDAYMAWGGYQRRCNPPSRPQDKWQNKDVDFSSILKYKFITAHRAPGRTCLDAISGGYNVWNESKGCGAVMRAAPYGLIKDYEDGAKAFEDGNLTHKHPIGWMSGVILARIIHDIVYNNKELIDAVENNIMYVPDYYLSDTHDIGFHWENFNKEKAIEEFQNLLKLAVKLAYNDRPNVECIKQLGQGWCGDEALAIAIFSALRFEDDFSDAICCAVNHDGDSDSTGAITGNILGALYGYEAIPDEWKHKLEGHDEILELATKFYDSIINE